MPWQISALLRALVAYGVQPTVTKKVVDLPSPTRRLVWMFGLCFAFSAVALAVTRQTIHLAHAWVAILGALNCVALYWHWNAVRISLSKSAIFAQMDDVVAFCCAAIFLGEVRFITLMIGVGIVLCLIGVYLFAFVKDRAGVEGERINKQNRKMILFVLGYSVLWGLDLFVSRIAGVNDVSVPEYTFWRYGSSWIGALILMRVRGTAEAGSPLTKKGVLGVGVLAAITWVAMLLEYSILRRVPLTVVQPIFQISELLFPPLAGWLLFKEHKTFRMPEWVGFAFAIAGGLVIAFSY